MAKKKRKELKPWCWYCDREFEDEKVLINHQKAKHFKCSFCNKKLNTAGGMLVHLQQVHKEDIRIVPNCIPGRESIDIEIFGMEGVPYEDLERHIREKEQQSTVAKKQKFEQDPETIKAQFAAFQAKKEDPGFAAVAPAPKVSLEPPVPPVPVVPVVPLPIPPLMGFPGMPFIPGMPVGLPVGIPMPILPLAPPINPISMQPPVTKVQMPANEILIYDESISVEEKRAMLPRYQVKSTQ